MKKKFFALILAAVCMLSFCGCSMILDLNTKINSDGSGTFTYTTAMDEELKNALAELGEDGSDLPMDQFVEMEIDGEKCYGMSFAYSFDAPDELQKALTDTNALEEAFPDGDFNGDTLFESVEVTKKSFKGTVNPGLVDSETAEMTEYGITIKQKFTVSFDKEIVETNGVLSEDKKSASWDLSTFDGEMFAEAKSGPSKLLIAVIASVVVLAGVLILTSGRKKKAAEAEAAVSAAADEEVAPAGFDAEIFDSLTEAAEATGAAEAAVNVVETIETAEAAETAADTAETGAEAVTETLEEAAAETAETVKETAEEATETAEPIFVTIEEAVADTAEVITETVEEAVADTAVAATETVEETAEAAETAAEVVETLDTAEAAETAAEAAEKAE